MQLLRRMAVGEPVHHLRAEAGNDSHPHANETTAHHQPPFAQTILDPIEQTASERHRLLLDTELGQSQIQRRGNTKRASAMMLIDMPSNK